MYITHFVCHCYLARLNFRLIYCNECPLVWICDEWVESLSISQPVLHSTPAFTGAGDRWPTVPSRSHSGGCLVSISCFSSSREVERRHTRCCQRPPTEENPDQRGAHSNGCWTPFPSNFSDLQPVLALRRLPLTEIPLTSLSDADVLVSTKATHNAAIKCTALDAISFECKMRSKHSGNYRGNFGKKRENQKNKEWEQSSK